MSIRTVDSSAHTAHGEINMHEETRTWLRKRLPWGGRHEGIRKGKRRSRTAAPEIDTFRWTHLGPVR